jgi:hypothetical protein
MDRPFRERLGCMACGGSVSPGWKRALVLGTAVAGSAATAAFLGAQSLGGWLRASVPVSPNLEDKRPDGSPFNPNTQSLLRGHHWLDEVSALEVGVDGNGVASVELSSHDRHHTFRLRNVPMAQLVPRLYYTAATPPDAFDALNLLLAEYSRNGLDVPVGAPGDTMAHFETDLTAEAPWTLKGDFEFVANPLYRPLRFAVTNNCLGPGLWEFAATDRAGEIYHAWFELPHDAYLKLVARANGVGVDFVEAALKWKTDPVAPSLDRLRVLGSVLGEGLAIRLQDDGDAGYSSQDSRRKIANGFAMVEDAEALRAPSSRAELIAHDVLLPEFVPPGKYSLAKRRKFDVRFLGRPRSADVRRVVPKTSYRIGTAGAGQNDPEEYIEIGLSLEGYRIVLGNLPLRLLVPQEEFVIHGFGVGILAASEPAERRRFLYEIGPAPSFAYLIDTSGSAPLVRNSHDFGIEQVFIRSRLSRSESYFEITVTSFERIVDLVRYRVPIPQALEPELRRRAERYVSPLFLTYQDDNVR